MTQDREGLERLLAKATPGLTQGAASAKALAGLLRSGAERQRPQSRDLLNGSFDPEADAALIVAAVNALPSLLAQQQAAQQRVEALEVFVRDVDAASLSGGDTVSLLLELGRIGKAARALLTPAQPNG